MKRMNIPYKEDGRRSRFLRAQKSTIKLIDAIGRSCSSPPCSSISTSPRASVYNMSPTDARSISLSWSIRALLGSVERRCRILIEHYAGAFPLWLAPVQVEVCTPVSEKSRRLRQARHRETPRSAITLRRATTATKTARKKSATRSSRKIPYMLVVGPKEAEAGTVSVRHRSKGEPRPKPLAELVESSSAKSIPARLRNPHRRTVQIPQVILNENVFAQSVRLLTIVTLIWRKSCAKVRPASALGREPGFPTLV